MVRGVKLTQSFKLMQPNKRKRELLDMTIEKFRECVNAWLSEIEQLGEYPTRKNVHSFAYKRVREQFKDLHSNVVQEAMNSAIETYRAWLRTKGQKPTPIGIISLQDLGLDTAVPEDHSLLCAAEFRPYDLIFNTPVQLIYTLDKAEVPGTTVVLGFYDSILEKIISTSKPKPRYYITKATYILGFLKKILPTGILDKVLYKI